VKVKGHRKRQVNLTDVICKSGAPKFAYEIQCQLFLYCIFADKIPEAGPSDEDEDYLEPSM